MLSELHTPSPSSLCDLSRPGGRCPPGMRWSPSHPGSWPPLLAGEGVPVTLRTGRPLLAVRAASPGRRQFLPGPLPPHILHQIAQRLPEWTERLPFSIALVSPGRIDLAHPAQACSGPQEPPPHPREWWRPLAGWGASQWLCALAVYPKSQGGHPYDVELKDHCPPFLSYIPYAMIGSRPKGV